MKVRVMLNTVIGDPTYTVPQQQIFLEADKITWNEYESIVTFHMSGKEVARFMASHLIGYQIIEE